MNCSSDCPSVQTVLQLDNLKLDLKGFNYHTDPTFDKLSKNVITETSLIIVTVRLRT